MGGRRVKAVSTLAGAVVLASRSEVKRGQWNQFKDAPLTVKPVGSVAYKLAVVAADMEWDIGAPWYRPTRVNHVPPGARVRLAQRLGQVARVLSR